MTITTLNPFRPTRWEHQTDGRPLIWFTDEAEELAAEKSTYLYGPRGTGKTTLLKSICWEDLCFNDSLRIQRRLGDFRSIGIYIRFPDHIAASMAFDDWGSIFPKVTRPEFEFYRFFTLAVESICIAQVAEACHALRGHGELKIEASQEVHLVQDFVDEFPNLASFSRKSPTTLLELARCLRGLVSQMNQACGRNTVEKIVDHLPVREPYQMLAFFTERASADFRLMTSSGHHRIGFKFCLDDCEVLNPLQRKSLNSLVRLSRAPVSWVVTSVGGGREDSETFLISQPLTDADRRVVSLETRNDQGFRRLCQSVVSLRLIFSDPSRNRDAPSQENVADFFNLDRRLGKRTVNDIFADLVRRSERPQTRILQRGAEHLLNLLSSGDQQRKGNSLPFYEAYVLMLSRGSEDAFKVTLEETDIGKLDSYVSSFKKPAFKSWLRRKQRGALLHLASSLGTKRIPYGGANIIVSLADGSIRDFLEIMGEIYEAYVVKHSWDPKDLNNLKKFAASGSRIAVDTQTAGIYSASESYFEGVSKRSEIDTDVISRLVAGLGTFTSLLQANSSDPRILSTAERGIFFVNYDPHLKDGALTQKAQYVSAAIRQAELAGYIRPANVKRFPATSVDGQFSSIAFRLHRRFAPHFKFSFRGAYEGVSLNLEDIFSLCAGGADVPPNDWAKRIATNSPLPNDGQLELQIDMDDHNGE